jgi:hypothetical protein
MCEVQARRRKTPKDKDPSPEQRGLRVQDDLDSTRVMLGFPAAILAPTGTELHKRQPDYSGAAPRRLLVRSKGRQGVKLLGRHGLYG